MSLLKKLTKLSTLDNVSTFSESSIIDGTTYPTNLKVLNVAFSGSIHGGVTSGLTQLAGPSKHFKTLLALLCASAFLRDEKDGVLLFYDNEFGASADYFEMMGIDTNRVLHLPFTSIEDLKFDVVKKLKEVTRDDKVMIVIDSIGNAASKKEIDDAEDEKSVADMTRAKAIKSLWRIVTPHLTAKDIPCIAINHTYQSQTFIPQTVVSGGTGIYYSSNNIFVIGRAQVKEGKEVVGYDFNINIEKSRGAKEKTKLPFTVTFEGGVNKYAGLFDVAKDLGFINMPTSGYYTRVIKGTEEDKKWRRKEIEYSDEWWEPIISDPAFDRAIQNKYKLVHNNDIEDDIDLSEEV